MFIKATSYKSMVTSSSSKTFVPQIRNYAPNMIQKRKESASLVKSGHSALNVTIKTYKCPLPHHATWGNTQNLTTKNGLLPEFSYKGSCQCRMKREVVHQMSGDILYAWAATEINAYERTDDFAVLITIQPASHTEGWVDYRWELGVKLLHYWKKPPKGESSSDFIATFTMSVGFDTYFDLQH